MAATPRAAKMLKQQSTQASAVNTKPLSLRAQLKSVASERDLLLNELSRVKTAAQSVARQLEAAQSEVQRINEVACSDKIQDVLKAHGCQLMHDATDGWKVGSRTSIPV